MATTTESEVRDFARQYDTANVRRLLWLCESGQITWAQAHGIARQALAAGIQAVAK